MYYWSTTTFRQQCPLKLNWSFEKSIAAIVIYKRSICKIHRKQLNMRLLVANSTCKLKFVPNWNLVLFASTENTHFPAISNFCAGLGRRGHPTVPERRVHRHGPASFFKILLFFRFPWAGRDSDQSSTRTWLRSELTSLSTWTCSSRMESISCMMMGNPTKLRLANLKRPGSIGSGPPVQVNY